MNTVTVAKTAETVTETPFSEERRRAIALAKARLLSDENKPYRNEYGTKFKLLGASDFAAYAILRGKNWRAGIYDLKENVPKYQNWKDLIKTQYWNTTKEDLISKEDWETMVEQAFKDHPEE